MFFNFMENVRLLDDGTVCIGKAISIDSLPFFIVTVLCVSLIYSHGTANLLVRGDASDSDASEGIEG